MTINSSLTIKEFLDEFSGAITTLLNNWIKRLLGPGADNTVVGVITWADSAVMLCYVILLLVVSALAAAIVRHHTKRTAAAEGEGLQHHVFGALGKPLYVLILAYGIYFAATPLLLKLKPDEGLRVVRAFFDHVFVLVLLSVHACAGSAASGLGV